MLDFIRRRPAALKASAWLTFAEIVRWQRIQHPKIWCPATLGESFDPPTPSAAWLHFSSAESNWAGICPRTNQLDLLLPSFPRRLLQWRTDLPSHLPAHTAKPIFPRQHRRTAWWDTGLEAGGCFKQTRMIWQCRLYLGCLFWGRVCY